MYQILRGNLPWARKFPHAAIKFNADQICAKSRFGNSFLNRKISDINNVIEMTPNPVKPCARQDYRAYWYGCYKLHRSPQSWDNAKAVCTEEGGYLVTIIAEAENAAMQLTTAEDDLPVWTGGRDTNIGSSTVLKVVDQLYLYVFVILIMQ